MPINIPGRADVAVPQPFADFFKLEAPGKQQTGTGVPLRYNKDKRKKPLFSRGLSGCRHLFNSLSKLKLDEKFNEKRGCFIKDKI